MESGLTTWIIGALISIGVFLNGLRFARMDKNPWADRTFFGMQIQGSDMPIKQVRMMGQIQMIFAPLFLVIWTLGHFGVFGPVDGIETIELN